MSAELQGRAAIVTGGASGIGRAVADRLRSSGARVLIADLDVSAVEQRDDLLAVPVDLRNPAAAESIAARAVEAFGRLDILVNNAGVARTRESFLATSDEDWEGTLSLNLMGYVRASRAALKFMQNQGTGCLVHVASEAARMPNPLLPDYSVSKAAVAMLSKVIATEFAPHGIRSNVVSPAFIRTPIYDLPGGLADTLAAEFGVDRETALQRYVELNRIPAGRLGTADEVAEMIHFLVTDRASFISGANFLVDGGVTPVV